MKTEDKFKPDYNFLTEIHDEVNFYDIVRELQDRGREEIYDSDILYCMVKATKAYHQFKIQDLTKEVEKNIESLKAEYNHLLDDRKLEEAYDRWKKIEGMKIALSLITNLEE